MIFQEPMTALNPVYTIGFQIAEMMRSHQAMAPKLARQRAIELLRLVEIPEPERRVDAYPHELSGGQRQRAMIAQALAMDPRILIADEPTTALDVTVQAEILKLVRDLRDRIDAGILLITHDMGVVADLSDRVIVMQRGRIVESGDAVSVFHAPKDPYTQELLRAVPHLGAVVSKELEADREPARPAAAEEPPPSGLLVDLQGVAIEYPKRGRAPAFRAVSDVTLTIEPAEVVGLVGESGSGKTTIGRAIVGLLPFVEGTASVLGTDMVGISKDDAASGPPRRQLRVPGPRLVAQPAPPGRGVDRGAAAAAAGRQGRRARASASRTSSIACTSPATYATAIRTSSRADNVSASASPGRSPLGRVFSSPTSRRPRSTSPSRRASSTCSRSCSARSASPACSSPTTWQSSRSSPSASP